MRQDLLAACQIEQRDEYGERNQRQQIRHRTSVQRIRLRQPANPIPESRQLRQDHRDRDQNARDRAARDVARRHQHDRALVALSDELFLAELFARVFLRDPFVDPPAHETADEDRRRRREREIDADRERERRNA